MLSQKIFKISSDGRWLTETKTWLNEFHKGWFQVPGQTSAEEDSFKNPTQRMLQKKNGRRGATLREISAGSWTDNLEPGLPGRCGGDTAKNSALGCVQQTQTNKQRTLETEMSALTLRTKYPIPSARVQLSVCI